MQTNATSSPETAGPGSGEAGAPVGELVRDPGRFQLMKTAGY